MIRASHSPSNGSSCSSPSMLSSSLDSRSPSSKRARLEMEWRRILDHRQRHAPLIFVDDPPLQVLEKICESHLDHLMLNDDEVKKLLEWVESVKRATNMSKRVFYQQNDYTRANDALAPGTYQGSLFLGRMFAKNRSGSSVLRSQGIKRIIRNTLYRDTHYDIDIVNCHPTIAASLFGHLQIPTLKDYVDRRDLILQDLEDVSLLVGDERNTAKTLPPDIVKKAIGAILNNAGPLCGFYGDNVQYARAIQHVPLFSRLRTERAAIYKDIAERYTGFYQFCSQLARKSGSVNVDGKAFSLFIQDVENEIVISMVHKIKDMFRGKDVDNLILIFDGLLIPKHLVENVDQLISELEDYIYETMDIKIKLAVKAMEPYIEGCEPRVLPPPVNVGVTYEAWKMEFEKVHYRLEFPSCYAHIGRHQTSYYNISKFTNEVCVEHDKDYVKEWIQSQDKRKYHCEKFAPYPKTAESDELNTFDGLRAESLESVADEDLAELIKPILYHVKVLAGGVTANYEFMMKWMARRIQFPGVLPLVGLAIRSVEGTGKDSFFGFLGSKIIGEKYFTQAPDLSSIFADKHSMATKDKLLVIISECTRHDTNSQRQKLKSFMTATTVKYRPLYIEEMVRDNYAAVVMFGQDQQFLNLDGDDRRFVVMDSLPIHANDPAYFSKLIPMLERDDVARAFYQHLLSIDVTSFKPSKDRPMTMARTNMVGFSAKPFYVFLKEFIPEFHELQNPVGAVATQDTFSVSRMLLFDKYQDFVMTVYPKFKDDLSQKRKFLSEVRTLVNDAIVKVSSGIEESKGEVQAEPSYEAYYPFKMITVRGEAKIKIDVRKMMAFLKRYVPDDDVSMVDVDLN